MRMLPSSAIRISGASKWNCAVSKSDACLLPCSGVYHLATTLASTTSVVPKLPVTVFADQIDAVAKSATGLRQALPHLCRELRMLFARAPQGYGLF